MVRRALLSSLLALLATLTPGTPCAAAELPVDATEGVIDGNAAMIAWPARYQGGKVVEYLSPEGLEVHLVDVREPGREIVHPAGTWFPPPRGTIHAWLEGGWRMSPRVQRFVSPGPRPGDRGRPLALRLAPAGKVSLPPAWRAEGGELRLLHLARDAGRRPDQAYRYELGRRSPASAVGEGLRLPVGPALATLWGPEPGELLALSRPFRVEHREVVTAPLKRPAAGAHLLVRLDRHEDAWELDDHGVEMALRLDDGRSLEPDVLAPTATRVYGAWYDLPPGPAVLTAGSRYSALVPETLELEAGQVYGRELELVERRSLEVELDLVSPLSEEAVELAVRALPRETLLAEAELDAGEAGYRFDGLPPVPAEVELVTSYGSFRRRVDLREAVEPHLVLDPDLLHLWGTVYSGDDGHAASITFTTVGNERVTLETGGDGSYDAELLEPVRIVEVKLAGSEAAPFVDFYPRSLAEDRELDFHLLDVVNRVEVVDARSGEPVAGARVAVRNEYEVETEAGETTERAVAQSAESDEEGVAILPAFREGRVEVTADADGYLPMGEPVRLEVLDATEDREIRVELEPVGDTAELRLRLPDGSPAVGAEVMLTATLADGDALFTGRSGGDGTADLPRSLAGTHLLIRHPAAALAVREWRPPEDGRAQSLDLRRPAPEPLVVEVRTPDGAAPAGRAEIALWLDGRRLSGGPLVWLTRQRPVAGPGGFWTVHDLPPAPVRVLAYASSVRDQARAGALDTLATDIPYPWPEPAVVVAVR